MEECKKCTEIVNKYKGYLTPEQLASIGNPEFESWCKICLELMMANVQLKHRLLDQSKPIPTGASNDEPNGSGFNRFDVKKP